MPDFDIDAALSFCRWDSYEHLVATATNYSDSNGDLTAREASPSDYYTYKPASVCFYPGGGGDWQPLVKFPKCKTFIYCDLALPENHGGKTLAEMSKDIEKCHPELRYVKHCQHSWEGDTFHVQMLEWERKAVLYLESLWALHDRQHSVAEDIRRIVRTYRPRDHELKRCTWVGCFQRKLAAHDADSVTILYLTVESLSAYVNLFFVNDIAPGVICFKPYVGFSCGQLTDKMLNDYGAVLKNDHSAHNSLLVVPPDRKANTPWMSDWNRVQHPFEDWGRTAYSAKPEQPAPAV